MVSGTILKELNSSLDSHFSVVSLNEIMKTLCLHLRILLVSKSDTRSEFHHVLEWLFCSLYIEVPALWVSKRHILIIDSLILFQELLVFFSFFVFVLLGHNILN